ncbi:hypothetical protein BH09BAC1_BH09BAC1_27700 [soil metagenome]
MRLFILLLFLATAIIPTNAQVLDTVEALMASGRVVDAKQRLDAISDSVTQGTIRYQLTKAHLYKELFKQSLQLFGIKNNNWLVISCDAYVDGVTALAKITRVPDSLFALITDCYGNAAREGIYEVNHGSKTLAEDLFYTAHYSASLWSIISGIAINDTNAQYTIGMYFYQRGQQATTSEAKQEYFTRARHYLLPLAVFKREDVLAALKEIN